MTDEAPPSAPRRLHWDGSIGAGQVLQALVVAGMGVAVYIAVTVALAVLDTRMATLERDSGAGSRIVAALRANVDAMQIRIVALEANSQNTLDRIEREYQERKEAQQAIQDTLNDYGRTLTSIATSVSAIAASTSISPGVHQ